MSAGRGLFVHARLADNVEISNPMYLAGEDEPAASRTPRTPPAPRAHNVSTPHIF